MEYIGLCSRVTIGCERKRCVIQGLPSVRRSLEFALFDCSRLPRATLRRSAASPHYESVMSTLRFCEHFADLQLQFSEPIVVAASTSVSHLPVGASFQLFALASAEVGQCQSSIWRCTHPHLQVRLRRRLRISHRRIPERTVNAAGKNVRRRVADTVTSIDSKTATRPTIIVAKMLPHASLPCCQSLSTVRKWPTRPHLCSLCRLHSA